MVSCSMNKALFDLKGYRLMTNGKRMRWRTIKVLIPEETTKQIMMRSGKGQTEAEWEILRTCCTNPYLDDGLMVDDVGDLVQKGGEQKVEIPHIYLGRRK